MPKMLRTALVGIVCMASLSSAQESIAAGDTARNADWPVIGGNSDVRHYSPLTQINDSLRAERHVNQPVDCRHVDRPGQPERQDVLVVDVLQ